MEEQVPAKYKKLIFQEMAEKSHKAQKEKYPDFSAEMRRRRYCNPGRKKKA